MSNGAKVLTMLIPSGGWAIQGDDFDSIHYDEGITPITKQQFEAALLEIDAWDENQKAAKIAKRDAALVKLAALGLDVDDLAALGL
jgi:hypothetical protein